MNDNIASYDNIASCDALANVVEGKAEINVAGESFVLNAGEMIIVPANQAWTF